MFRHAVAGELIDVVTVERLKALEPLRKGQTKAPEKERTKPVPLETVRQTAKHLSPIIKSMLRIQISTGMRPKELCMMRPCDIDRSGDVWIYRPSQHKTDWCGREKAIPLVGDARDAVTEYLQRDPESYVSRLRGDGVAARQGGGKTCDTAQPRQPSGYESKSKPEDSTRERYDAASYRQAITRAAKPRRLNAGRRIRFVT